MARIKEIIETIIGMMVIAIPVVLLVVTVLGLVGYFHNVATNYDKAQEIYCTKKYIDTVSYKKCLRADFVKELEKW